jgi:hypothetical protein
MALLSLSLPRGLAVALLSEIGQSTPQAVTGGRFSSREC